MPIAEQFARELDKARRSGRTLETLLSERGLQTIDEAYAVQRADRVESALAPTRWVRLRAPLDSP